MQTPSFTDDLPSRNPDLLNQVRESILLPLADAFAAVLDALGGGLFELADKAPPALQKDCLDAIQELRRERESLIARFRMHLAKAWQALEAGRPLSVERTLSRGNDLTLVADSELEVRLAIRNLAGAIQQQWRPELMRLDRYLGFVAGGLRLGGDTNPVGPEHLGTAVYSAFSGSRIAVRAQLAAVRLIEPGMVERVGALYAALERQLVAIGHSVRLPEGRSRRRGIPGQTLGDAEPADWTSRFFSQWQGAERTNAGVGGAIDVHLRGDHELLPAELHQLLRGARAGDEADGAAKDARTLSPRELVSALSLLQTAQHGGFEEVDQAGDLRAGLRREVFAHVARLGVDPQSVRLDPADADALDLVAMLFQAMLSESQLGPQLRPVLGQLLAPVAKVALQDSRLFVRDSHPVRRLLNMLADACDGNPGGTAAELALLAQVQAVAARVTQDFDEHLGVFLQAESEFGAYYEQYRRRVEIAERRAAELQRAEERRVAANALAAGAIEVRLRERTLPPVLEGFLRRPWAQHLERAALREGGADGQVTGAALALADGLLAAMEPAGRDDAWLDMQRPALQRIYAEAGLGPGAAEAAAGTLLEVLRGVRAVDAPAPELPPAPAMPAAADDEAASPLPEEPPEQLGFDIDTAGYFQALPLGTWLDFVDRLGRVQPGKLAWVSPISGRRMFVNRRGARFCVASSEQLAAMVRLGRLRLHREEDAFYSAMQSVVDSLDRPSNAA